jgi:hypothetical protein
MEEKFIFSKVEEEEELEEAWLNDIHVEKKDIGLGNVLIGKEKIEKHIFFKHRNMWKHK